MSRIGYEGIISILLVIFAMLFFIDITGVKLVYRILFFLLDLDSYQMRNFLSVILTLVSYFLLWGAISLSLKGYIDPSKDNKNISSSNRTVYYEIVPDYSKEKENEEPSRSLSFTLIFSGGFIIIAQGVMYFILEIYFTVPFLGGLFLLTVGIFRMIR